MAIYTSGTGAVPHARRVLERIETRKQLYNVTPASKLPVKEITLKSLRGTRGKPAEVRNGPAGTHRTSMWSKCK